MRRKKGFTLVELMVVIAIIALLITFLMPGLASALESARQTKCGEHMKGIGTAVMGSSTEGILAKTKSATGYKWDTDTDTDGATHLQGVNRYTDPLTNSTAMPLSHNFYALIHRNDANPENFACPGDCDCEVDLITMDQTTGDEYWDFLANINTSYSFQAGVNTTAAAPTVEVNPLNNPKGTVVIMGDRTPALGNVTGCDALPDVAGTWTQYHLDNQGPTEDSRGSMPQNHKGDIFIGLQFAGGLASYYGADCGYQKDNVFSPSDQASIGEVAGTPWWDVAAPTAAVAAGDITAHETINDSFLVDTPDN